MKFGLVGGAAARRGEEIGDSQGYQDFVDLIVEAETLGYHSIFIVEHHFTGIGQVSATLNMLTYLAAKTSKIRLGTGVTVLPWHNPVILAEQAASLDLLSGGRLDFGAPSRYLSLTENEVERQAALDRRMNMLDRLNDFGQLPGLPAIPDDPKEARRQAEEAAIIGTSAEAIEKIKRLQDMGVEYILLTATGSIQLMRNFAAEVMPAFAEEEEPVLA